MELGIHLTDLLSQLLDITHDTINTDSSSFSHHGRPLDIRQNLVEDYATSLLLFEGGPSVQLSCSWNLPAGRDAVIGITLYGQRGGGGPQQQPGAGVKCAMLGQLRPASLHPSE